MDKTTTVVIGRTTTFNEDLYLPLFILAELRWTTSISVSISGIVLRLYSTRHKFILTGRSIVYVADSHNNTPSLSLGSLPRLLLFRHRKFTTIRMILLRKQHSWVLLHRTIRINTMMRVWGVLRQTLYCGEHKWRPWGYYDVDVVVFSAPRLVVRDTTTGRRGCGSRCVFITPCHLFVTRIHDDTASPSSFLSQKKIHYQIVLSLGTYRWYSTCFTMDISAYCVRCRWMAD